MGAYRSSPLKTKSPVQGDNKKLSFCANGMCGWRISMEDAHVAKPNFYKDCSLFCVFDGHGGPQVAKFAEKHFPEELLKNKNFQKRLFEAALIESFLKIDELLVSQPGRKEIQALKKQLEQNKGGAGDVESFAGCTANVVLITETEIYCANAGDSRSILSVKGKADPLSIDHKPEDEEELKRIRKGGGDVWEGRVNGNLNLSRAMGDLQYKSNKGLKPEEQIITAKPDVQKRNLAGADFIVMGCDGIWECKTNQQIADYVGFRLKSKNLKQITEQLLDDIVAPDTSQEHGLDNMTVIVIQFKK